MESFIKIIAVLFAIITGLIELSAYVSIIYYVWWKI